MSDSTAFDDGDQAWQLTAATLVAFQSVPGLVIMYAGLSKTKWAINSAFMAFYAFAATLLVWVLYGYGMAFGTQWIPICGVPYPMLGIGHELAPSELPAAGVSQAFNMATMAYFHAITVVILAGAVLGRMNFLAWAIFVWLWVTFSYTVVAFSIWGGGFLYQLGVIDYSGGYVIHVSSGTAGFLAAAIVGPRHPDDRAEHRPSNLGFVMIGAGLLWIGWNGFNGGDPYAANADAGVAVLNTNICTATSLLTWTLLDVAYYKKPAILGSVQGMITGLVAITPAAGVIAGWSAIVMGVLSGSIPWATMNFVGKWRPLSYVDDTLGVFHTHLVAGIIGGFFTGIFATDLGSQAFGLEQGGAIDGHGRQVWVQIVGFLFVIAWNLAWVPIILFGIRYILRIPLRASDEVLLVGDDAIHGEAAYALDSVPLLDRGVHDSVTTEHVAKKTNGGNEAASGGAGGGAGGGAAQMV